MALSENECKIKIKFSIRNYETKYIFFGLESNRRLWASNFQCELD